MLLYIHIPFCDSKCHYCAFNSYTSLHHLRDEYVNALCLQLEFELKKIDKNDIETIFIGGGTPSVLNKQHYMKIFDLLKSYITNTKEITIEANPNSATYSWLEDMYSLGINRVSFGVQSFNDEKLKYLGRNHTSKMAINAIQNASEIGFKHINCDIIYDTKLDTKELLTNDLNMIKDLPVDHVSAYSLIIEEDTKFYKKSENKIENIENANFIFDSLKEYGFKQYEISNFAKNTQAQSKHNKGYWEYKEYLGIGAGAIGCIDHKRLYNEKDISLYINNPTIYVDIEELSTDDIKVEKVLLGLRCDVGVNKKLLNEKELLNAYNLVKNGKLTIIEDDIFYVVDYLLADEIALYIME